MTAPEDITLRRTPLRREAVRWGLAGLIVTTAHVSLAYGVAMLAPVPERASVEEAMTVELTPLVVSTAEPVELDTVEEERPEIVSELEEQEPVEPEQQVEEAQPEETTEQAEEQPEETVEEEPEEVAEEEPVETVEPIPEVKKAEVVLPKKAPVRKPPPKKVQRKPPPEKPVVRKAEPKPRPSASRQAKAGAAAPRAPTVSPSRWFAQVQAAVARRKPRSLGASGIVRVRFVVNSAGSIVSAGIARSSGHSSLDQAALSMVHSARVPAPPAGLGRSSFPFTIPVKFE